MPDYTENLLDTETCVVTFATGDGWHLPGVPHFEFGNLLRKLDVSYVLMRDGSDAWYSDGVVGLGNAKQTAEYISHLAARYMKVVTMGVSYGSYGALLYAQTAHVGESIVVSPVTVLGTQAKAEFDEKWRHRIDHPRDLDLKPLFPKGPLSKCVAFITDGDGAELDAHMARRLQIEDIRLIPGQTHGSLAKYLRDHGYFEALLG